MTDEELLIKVNLHQEDLLKEINEKIENTKPRLTQRKMSKDLGFYPQNLNSFLKGRAKLSFKKIKTIVDYLNM